MHRLGTMVVLAGLLTTAGTANGQSFKERYIGKNSCSPDTLGGKADFGLRLDKTRPSYLIYRDMGQTKILLIVQADENSRCGVIQDLVEIRRISKDFEFRCFDQQSPTDVIIGTAVRNGTIKPVTAIDAWRIDLKEQKFVPTSHKVTCSAEGWDGEDTGSDMVDESKKYAAHGKPGQFGPESK